MYTHLHTYIWPLSGVCIARNRKPERWGHPRGLMFARDSTWEILCARQSAGERHAYTYTHIIYIHLQGTCKCTLPFSTLPCHPPPRCSQNLAHTKTHTNTHIVRFCLLRVWCACCMLMRICMSTFVCFCVVCAFMCVVCLLCVRSCVLCACITKNSQMFLWHFKAFVAMPKGWANHQR